MVSGVGRGMGVLAGFQVGQMEEVNLKVNVGRPIETNWDRVKTLFTTMRLI